MGTVKAKWIAAGLVALALILGFRAAYNAGVQDQRIKEVEADNAQANDIRRRLDGVRVQPDDIQFRDKPGDLQRLGTDCFPAIAQ